MEAGITTAALASAELLRRERMHDSLVAFAENVQIPGAPLVDEGDLPFEFDDGSGKIRVTTLNELDDVSVDIENWSRKKEVARAIHTEYGNIFAPIGSGLALHHRILLEKIQECMEKKYGRLMIFMPPGAAKSTYATVLAPVWRMGKLPGTQIILASYATPIAKKLGSKGRFVVEQDAFGGTFRDKNDNAVMLSKSTQAKEMWAMTNGSEYMSGGLLSGMTGNRADGVVIDDPVKGRQAAESKTERDRTYAAFQDDLTTRLKPGAWQVLIQTRWAPEDLAGTILPEDYDGQSGQVMCRDGLKWEVLNIPGKCEREDDPLGREIGEYLWPEWFDEQFWKMYEPRPGDPNSPSERRWSALFQQRPRPDTGNMFQEEDFNRYDVGREPPSLNFYVASDYATQEDEGDWTEHGVYGIDNVGQMHFVDWFYGQVDTGVGINELLKLCKKRKIWMGFGESGVIRHAIEPAFRRRQRELGIRLNIKYLPSAGRKASKILSFQSMARNGKVWIPNCPWGDRLIAQLCDFDGRDNPKMGDDGADVCALAGRSLDDLKWSANKVAQDIPEEARFGSGKWLMSGTENEKKPIDWSVLFINPRTIENEYVSKLMSDSSDEVIHGLLPSLREEYLRNRFRSYMNHFKLYNNDDTQFELDIKLDDGKVIVSEKKS